MRSSKAIDQGVQLDTGSRLSGCSVEHRHKWPEQQQERWRGTEAQRENGDGQHEMQWAGGGLAARAARLRAAVEPQMRAVGEAGRRDWTRRLYLRMPCGQRPILTVS